MLIEVLKGAHRGAYRDARKRVIIEVLIEMLAGVRTLTLRVKGFATPPKFLANIGTIYVRKPVLFQISGFLVFFYKIKTIKKLRLTTV